MFLRNVGIYRRVYTAPQPRTTTLSSKMAVFWVVAPCSLVEVYAHTLVTSTRLHGATIQKTAIFILTAVRTSNIAFFSHFVFLRTFSVASIPIPWWTSTLIIARRQGDGHMETILSWFIHVTLLYWTVLWQVELMRTHRTVVDWSLRITGRPLLLASWASHWTALLIWERLRALICFREFPGSIRGLKTDNPNWDFPWYS
jgi:hypothetical protein